MTPRSRSMSDHFKPKYSEGRKPVAKARTKSALQRSFCASFRKRAASVGVNDCISADALRGSSAESQGLCASMRQRTARLKAEVKTECAKRTVGEESCFSVSST